MQFRTSLRVIFALASLFLATQSFADSDFGVTKLGPAQAPADTDVAYTVQVINAGPDDADVTLTDNIPVGMTFVSLQQTSGATMSCSDPGLGNGGTITCTNASMIAGTTADFTITLHISSQTPTDTTFTNIATVSTTGFDPNDENNSSAAATTVPANDADVGVQKTGPNVAAPGTDVAYTITVNNAGPSDATSVQFTDTLPGTMTFVSLTQNGGPTFGCTTGATVICSIATLTVGSAATFTLTGNIPAGTAPGTSFSNTVNVESDIDPNGDNNTSSSFLTVSNAELAVTKSGPGTATAGQTISYTITATNNGPDTAVNVMLADILPPGTTLSSFSQSTGPTFGCSVPDPGNSGTVTCTIVSLGSGVSATFSLVLNVNATFADGGTLTNTATFSSDSGDSNPNNNTSSTSATVTGVTDIAVTKTAPPTIDAGTNLSWTITVQNLGANPALNTQLSDTIPAGTTFVSFNQNSGPVFNCSGTTSITCSNASFAAGATATFTLVVSVPADATGTITNTANLATTTIDTNNGNDTSTANTTVTQNADLSVTKSGPSAAAVGTDVAYTITVSNAGPSDASSVTLSDTIPAPMSFVSMQQNSGPVFNCSGTTTVTCTLATFVPGASASFTLTVHVNSAGGISNTATISATTSDPNSGNNTSTVNTNLAQSADLAVTKSGPTAAAVGTDVAYTITVSNAGPSDASAVTLSDTLPAQMSFVSMQQNSGPVFNCSGTTTVTCTIASFVSGASASFTLTVHVNGAGSISNTATISATTSDPNPGNNTASASTTASFVDLAIVKSVSAGPYVVGAPVTFTLTVTNNGTLAATNVVVTDALPGGMSATATTPSGACTGTTTVTCTAATLAAGASTAFTITANLPALPGNYTNTATVSSATTEGTPADNSGSAGFAVVAAAAIPTLSVEVLALLAALLGIVGIIAMKR
jgi:uncharacterized repeat protein (TIGR01451 family)